MKNKIDIRETIELFINRTVNDLNSNEEVPRLKFVFKEEARKLFETVMKYPYKEDGWTTPNIKQKDIDRVMEPTDYTCDFINVPDALIFFKYLTDITNNQLKLYEIFNEPRIAREQCMCIMKRLWLRMGPNDFNNIEAFLDRQLKFVKDETLDEYHIEQTIADYYGYPVKALVEANRSWDESTRRMKIKIAEDNENCHDIPSILYDICDNTCYIYAIQNERKIETNKIPKIERLLYKLNKDVDNPTIHPSKVLALTTFIDILKEKGINTIKVPTLQVLSHPWHEILSKNAKEKFLKDWTQSRIEKTKYSNHLKNKYEIDKKWYHNIVDKEDLISESKTEKLIETIYRVLSNNDNLELVSDIDISDELIIKTNSKMLKK